MSATDIIAGLALAGAILSLVLQFRESNRRDEELDRRRANRWLLRPERRPNAGELMSGPAVAKGRYKGFRRRSKVKARGGYKMGEFSGGGSP
jgi:hypothetical protein